MKREPAKRCRGVFTSVAYALRDDRAAQILEFAISLPLLVLLVVGIFDFSNAFTLKQKLTNIARDAARIAAADPAGDLSQPVNPLPVSVADAYQAVENYLNANNINDCGLTANSTPSGLTWVFTANGNGCPTAGIKITVNRGYYFPVTGATLPTVSCTSQNPNANLAIVGTCVSIQYAYAWQFGRVASLFQTTTLPTTLNSVAVAMNEN
jgi:Flp pilus assembly protein TadG